LDDATTEFLQDCQTGLLILLTTYLNGSIYILQTSQGEISAPPILFAEILHLRPTPALSVARFLTLCWIFAVF